MTWKGKKISILYEDPNILAINKPAGLSVHASERATQRKVVGDRLEVRENPKEKTLQPETSNLKPEVTLVDLLLKAYPKIKGVGDKKVKSQKSKDESQIQEKNGLGLSTLDFKPILRPGIVHRLDKDTSGVMVIAKNQKTFEFLKEQFQNRTIEKIYYAYVYGWLKNDKGVIELPIGRSPKDVRMWSAGRGKRGTAREARTDYEVIKRIAIRGKRIVEEKESKGSTEKGTYTFVKLLPKTGRTHQLRVHLKYINHPIVSDPLYASTRMPKTGRGNKLPSLGFERLALHAASLSITLPNKKKLQIKAPFPTDFKKMEKVA